MCYSNMQKNNEKIMLQFCTGQDSWAVVACAKLWPDLIMMGPCFIRITIELKEFSSYFNCVLINHLWDGSQALLPHHMPWEALQYKQLM